MRTMQLYKVRISLAARADMVELRKFLKAMIEEMAAEDTVDLETAREMTHRAVSREYALDRDMTPEQLYAVISEEIDDIYANG